MEEALRTAALWLSRADALLVLADGMEEKDGIPQEPRWDRGMVQELGINHCYQSMEWHSCIFLHIPACI